MRRQKKSAWEFGRKIEPLFDQLPLPDDKSITDPTAKIHYAFAHRIVREIVADCHGGNMVSSKFDPSTAILIKDAVLADIPQSAKDTLMAITNELAFCTEIGADLHEGNLGI